MGVHLGFIFLFWRISSSRPISVPRKTIGKHYGFLLVLEVWGSALA